MTKNKTDEQAALNNEKEFSLNEYRNSMPYWQRVSYSFNSLRWIVMQQKKDGIYAGMTEEYYKETGVTFYDIANIKPIEEVYEVFSNSDYSTKKAVLFELLNLLYADGSYDTLEKDFLEKFAISIGLSNEDLDQIIDLVWKYIDVINKIADVITLSDNS